MTFTIKANKEIAEDSPDHLLPVGCINDNYSSSVLIDEVLDYFKGKKITALDLGCAGGQFVVDFINRGHHAIGLEGSSHVLNGQGQNNWNEYYNKNLFLCDITEEYQLYKNNRKLKFDYIHSEEVFEHIAEDKIDIMFSQIKKHLKVDGICSFGISLIEDTRESDGVIYKLHQSVFPAEWWRSKLIENGFKILDSGTNNENHFGYIFSTKVRDHAHTSCYICCTLN